MTDDQRTPILTLAGRTIARIERDSEVPLLLCAYDEYDKLLFKTMSLFDGDGFSFDTCAIDRYLDNNTQDSELDS